MSDTSIDSRALRKLLAAYQRPSFLRSSGELVLTVAILAAIWVAGWFAVSAGMWWLGLMLSIPAGGFIIRLFMIQHDCGHRSYFDQAPLNDWIGRILGVFTLTPYDCWRREHAIHHATSGNLDRRGPGAVYTLTLDEYRSASPLKRIGYRLYRHPAILFLVGPFFVFFIQQRLPVGLMREGWRPWVSALGTNIAIALLVALTIWLVGWQVLVFVCIPSWMVAASIGVWLFFVQHQFEDTHWSRQGNWDRAEAALKGSSHYDLPAPLSWLTGNIGIHHVHHVASRIPFYRLPTVLEDHPHLKDVGRLTLTQSIRCVDLALWDEGNGELISFGEYQTREQTRAAA